MSVVDSGPQTDPGKGGGDAGSFMRVTLSFNGLHQGEGIETFKIHYDLAIPPEWFNEDNKNDKAAIVPSGWWTATRETVPGGLDLNDMPPVRGHGLYGNTIIEQLRKALEAHYR
jgi:hypothetical protein